MRTLKFSILIDAIDCYIYSGYLFFVLENGTLSFTPISRIIRRLSETYPDYKHLFRLAFQRNDFFTNDQGDTIFGIEEIKMIFNSLWISVSEEVAFEIKIDSEDIEIVAELPSMPVLDMKLYGMKMFVGSREGLYQSNLESEDRYHLIPSKLRKVFDSKVMSLNARSGSIVISSNNDGLFYGNIFHSSGYAKIFEKPVADKSLRTGWATFDIINYEEQNSFDYYVNRVENTQIKNSYSKFDERRERHSISEFGVSKYGVSQLLRTSEISPEDISYCFNSSSSGFFFLKDGRFVNTNIRTDKPYGEEKNDVSQKEIHFSSHLQTLPTLTNDRNFLKKPISSSIVPNGCVIEYFNNVVLYHSNEATILESTPAINVRTFPTSLRYKNLICITKPNEISIHSIYPFKN